MHPNRIFFPQAAIEQWLEDGRISLVGEELTVTPEGRRFSLISAARFMTEVTDGKDPHDLVGKVKTLEQLTALSAEHADGAVILGDNAYEVIDGFLGEAEPTLTAPSTRRASHRKTKASFEGDVLSEILKQI